ncbi:MAG: PQQ-binding-like beta-propeller repeat protein [Fimbriimonadales bacterium]
MLSAIVTMAVMSDTRAPMPPYRRLATVAVFENSYDTPVAVDGNVFVAGSFNACIAYDLATMKKLWTAAPAKGEGNERIAISNGTVFVTTSPGLRKQASHLVAISEKTGKVLWSAPRTGDGSPMAFGPGVVYLSLEPFTLSAFDLRTRRARWTTRLAKGVRQGMLEGQIQAVTSAPGSLVTNCEAITIGLDPNTGKVLWSESNSSMYHGHLPAVAGIACVPANSGLVARELRSGKVLWRKPGVYFGDFGGVFDGKFVGISNGKVLAIDPRAGSILWSHEVGPSQSSGGNQYGAVLGGTLFVRGISRTGIYDRHGKEIWSGTNDSSIPEPCWTDGEQLVCFNGARLLRYVHGQEAPQPTDSAGRTALAQKLVEHFKELDQADIKRLEALGDYAFPAVLKAFLAACDAYDAKGENSNSMGPYELYHNLGDVLGKVTTRHDTQGMMDALDKAKPKSSAKPLLLTMLGQFGDPKDVTPYFLKELEGTKTPGFEMYESNTYVARTYIASSSDPRAVAFMIKQLQDPKGDGELKFEAYTHLAGTGGPDGLKAVLAERNHRKLLRPVSDRALSGYLNAGEFGTKTNPLGEEPDAQGRTWGLIQSGVLGGSGDLWLAEKVNGQWTNAVFSGVTLGSGTQRKSDANKPKPTVKGRTAEELAKGAWFVALVGSPDLAKDKTGCGLTDIEKRRLGLDPNQKDSDGDGDPDGVDPWPNAPYRTDLSDAEQVLAAAFEARYHFDESEGVGIFSAEPGMRPFEMPGRRGTMMWVASGSSSPLSDLWEQGVAFIGFRSADRDEKKPWEQRLITWNVSHTEARVLISTYFGGLNGTGYDVVVRRFGRDWVCVSMRMAFVS